MIHWESKPSIFKHLGDEEWQTEATLDLCEITQYVSPSLCEEPLLSIETTELQTSQNVNIPLPDSHLNRERKTLLSIKVILT